MSPSYPRLALANTCLHSKSLVVTDQHDTIIVACAAPPKDSTYQAAVRSAAALLLKKSKELQPQHYDSVMAAAANPGAPDGDDPQPNPDQGPDIRYAHRRGNYPCISTGVSHGTGSKVDALFYRHGIRLILGC